MFRLMIFLSLTHHGIAVFTDSALQDSSLAPIYLFRSTGALTAEPATLILWMDFYLHTRA